jgi:hypothetical protein
VCGWSADWDIALRTLLDSSIARRYPLYWMKRSEPSAAAENLVRRRGGSFITIADANSAFVQLNEKCLALETDANLDTITPHLAAVIAKKWLQDERHQIDLHDLVTSSVRSIADAFASGQLPQDEPFNNNRLFQRLDLINALMRVPIYLAIVCGAWGSDAQRPLIQRVIDSLSSMTYSRTPTLYSQWIELARWPAGVFWNACYFGAFSNGNFAMVKWLRSDCTLNVRSAYTLNEERRKASDFLTANSILGTLLHGAPGNKSFPESEMLSELLSPGLFKELYDREPAATIQRGEYFAYLIDSWNDGKDPKAAYANAGLLNKRNSAILIDEISALEDKWSPLLAGLFGESHVDVMQHILAVEGYLGTTGLNRYGD